jgi:hypothetical protein
MCVRLYCYRRSRYTNNDSFATPRRPVLQTGPRDVTFAERIHSPCPTSSATLPLLAEPGQVALHGIAR